MKQYDEIVFSGDVRELYEKFLKTKRDINYIKNVLDIGLIPNVDEQLFEDINRKIFKQFKEISDDSDLMLNWFNGYIGEMSLLNGGFDTSMDVNDNVYFNDAKKLLESDFDEEN